jgi:hypothetical protein
MSWVSYQIKIGLCLVDLTSFSGGQSEIPRSAPSIKLQVRESCCEVELLLYVDLKRNGCVAACVDYVRV